MLERVRTFVSQFGRLEWVAVAVTGFIAVAGFVGCVVACACGCRKQKKRKVGAPLPQARGGYYGDVGRLKI
jgi:hypothetical protein